MKIRNAAELFIATLHSVGVRRIYGVVGDSLNGITDALRRHGEIDWVHMRHEEAAAFAAGAEAHLTGELAVCAGSCGPGNLHLINGLFDCHRSRVPVLAIAAHIPSAEIGVDYFQETHPEQLFKECSHYCRAGLQPRAAAAHPGNARSARPWRSAASPWSSIPGDIALQDRDARRTAALDRPRQPVVAPERRRARRARRAAQRRRRASPCCAGAGCAGAHDAVARARRDAESADRPCPARQGICRIRQSLRCRHDRPDRLRLRLPAMKECDTLLMLGTDFPYRQFYPERRARSRRSTSGRKLWAVAAALDLGVVGDVRRHASRHCCRSCNDKTDRRISTTPSPHYKKARAGPRRPRRQRARAASRSIRNMSPRLVSELATDDAIFTCDVGTPTVWAARYLTMNGKRRLIGSFNHGSMANAMPQAIGAQAAYPGPPGDLACRATAASP